MVNLIFKGTKMNKEIIYVLTNSAMEGYVKIGRTTNLDQRLSSLDNTSVPLPFECVFAIEVEQGQCEADIIVKRFS